MEDLGHGDEGRFAGAFEIGDEQLNALADDLSEEVLLGAQVDLVGQLGAHLLLELGLELLRRFQAVLGRGEDGADAGHVDARGRFALLEQALEVVDETG